jgi:polysaccharide export outer membrane protein
MLTIRKTFIYAAICSLLSGCAPMFPDNYLGPSNIATPAKVQGKWRQPRVIPISTEMLDTPEGRRLLAPALKPQPYLVGSYDNLNIIVWGHPDISTLATAPTPATTNLNSSVSNGTVTINSGSNPTIIVQTDGTIFYPYVGHLKVAGLTVTEIQNQITQRLAKYIREPQVTIQVAKFRNRNAYVLGEVNTPGMQPLTDKPLTLMEAISSAGGINPTTADPRHIYLVRGSYEQPDIFLLNAQAPQSLMIAEHFPLQENDIVYVSGAALNPVNNFISKILPSISTYTIIKEFTP